MNPAARFSPPIWIVLAFADPGATVASVRVAIAVRDGAKLATLMTTLRPVLERGDARDLPWGRRVSLALVLAQAGLVDAARSEIQRCVEEADAERLRFLSSRELYQFQFLAKSFGIAMIDAALQHLARELMPAEMRARL